jgi:hypothetical protein
MQGMCHADRTRTCYPWPFLLSVLCSLFGETTKFRRFQRFFFINGKYSWSATPEGQSPWLDMKGIGGKNENARPGDGR